MRMKFKLFPENPNFLKVVAFLLALILWFFVTGDRKDLGLEVRRSFSNIPLTYRNLGQDLAVVGLEESVTLSLQGLPQAFDGLTPADLEAYVDLSGRQEGRHELRINAVAPPGVSIVSIEPAKVTVLLEDVITRQISVEEEIRGEPAGGKIVEDVAFEPAEVFIRGPRRRIELVEKVVFRLDISGQEEKLAESLRLYPLDRGGTFVQGITVIPESVEVQVTFALPQKDLPVKPVFVNEEREIEAVMVDPPQVTVMGPRWLLEELDGIPTEKIDLRGRENVFIIDEVLLDLPEGVTVNKDTVKVRVYLAE